MGVAGEVLVRDGGTDGRAVLVRCDVLTVDQRWLLMHMGGWQIVSALCSPEGTTHLMQSCWSSTAGRAADMPGAPEWLRGCGFQTQGGVVAADRLNGTAPPVRVKAAEINRYAASLPADIKAELLACRNAGTANAVMGYRLCRRPGKHEHLPYEDAICPATDEQHDEQTAEYWRVVDWQADVLAKALGLNGNPVEAEQLDLFEALA